VIKVLEYSTCSFSCSFCCLF